MINSENFLVISSESFEPILRALEDKNDIEHILSLSKYNDVPNNIMDDIYNHHNCQEKLNMGDKEYADFVAGFYEFLDIQPSIFGNSVRFKGDVTSIESFSKAYPDIVMVHISVGEFKMPVVNPEIVVYQGGKMIDRRYLMSIAECENINSKYFHDDEPIDEEIGWDIYTQVLNDYESFTEDTEGLTDELLDYIEDNYPNEDILRDC